MSIYGTPRFKRRLGLKSIRRMLGQTGSRYRPSAYRRRRARPRAGYTRTSGFYGRFRPSTNRFAITELKFHDIDVNDASVAQNGTIVEDSCCGIAQGTTEAERIGRKCVIKSINWRFNISLIAATANTNTAETVRLILYLDKQCNGATATVTGILESDNYQSFNNLANKGRFRTLMDRTYQLNSPSGSGRGTTDTLAFGEYSVDDSLYKKVNLPIEFDSVNGVITEIRSNNIGVLILSKEGNIAVLDSKMRLRFSDN